MKLQSHLPSLDGMRGILIFMVLICHWRLCLVGLNPYFEYIGHLGVFTFFVISGLLITWLMVREEDATGSFSLINFYIRRFLRILPAFWFLILAVIILKLSNHLSIGWPDILRAVTFTHNYPLSLHGQTDYSWWLVHTWSLSLEEQFYLIWPCLFFLLPRKFKPRFAVLLALAGPIQRLLVYFALPELRGSGTIGFESHSDVLMAGCASAFLLDSAAWRERIRRIPIWPALTVTLAFLFIAEPLLADHSVGHSRLAIILRLVLPTMEAVAIALLLLILVAGERGLAFRVVNWRPLTHVGKLSFSIYLWQQIFIAPGPHTWPGPVLVLWQGLETYIAGFCSFSFIERPFFALRSRFRNGVSV